MNRDPKYPLLVKPDDGSGKYQHLTNQEAGWELLNFGARTLNRKEKWKHNTGENEMLIVLLGGKFSIQTDAGSWITEKSRKNVFSGLPHAVYLSRHQEFTLMAESEILDIAYGWCSTDQDHPIQFIDPHKVNELGIEIRGGDNATRQINGILPPGSDCHHLVSVEVYTPSGNWSSFPAHKHDTRKVDVNNRVLEARLEETYFYKIDKPQGYAIQQVYTDDRSLDEIAVARNNDIVMVPRGYHPVVAGHGYNVYYLNFLTGSDQSLANSDDPDHAWIYNSWKGRDPRIPMVGIEMNK
jgi:5-deoxy-glucuronate isomerase